MEHVKHTPDYELLEIFTKGMLSDYRRFTQSSHGQTFLSAIHRDAGVDPSPFLERKIRQLTRGFKEYFFDIFSLVKKIILFTSFLCSSN